MCRARMREVRAVGVVVGERARKVSGLSRTRSVLRGFVDDARVETAVEIVALRSARSSDCSVWRPGVALLALGSVGVDGAMSRCGADTPCAGGPRAGTILPAGNPLTGSDCGPRGEDILPPFTPGACLLSTTPFCASLLLSRHNPLSPSTNANRPSLLSLSRSNPAPFLASCFQNSYSLIHDTRTTLCSSSPLSVELLSASQRKRMSSQFALAPRVLVKRSTGSPCGRWIYGCSRGGMRVDGGIVTRAWWEDKLW